MILHKDCLPIERKWNDKPYCYPFVYPWEVQLTDHFGLEHLENSVFDLQIELVNDQGLPAGVITSSFDVTIGLDSDDKNVFVAILKEFPEIMPTTFRLLVTISINNIIVYQQVTESYVFLNDQCVTAFVLPNTDWALIANGGRLVINGSSYPVTITGVGLPTGFTFGINNARQEISIAAEAGLANELYGEDTDGNRVDFKNAGTICNQGAGLCNNSTLLIEGIFDCSAPDGRYTGSILPFNNNDPDIRYRYFSRVYADNLTMPSDITRTISINSKTQRTERIRRSQVVGYVPIPTWQKEELETLLMASRIVIQGEEHVFTNGKPMDRMGVIGTSSWWFKADFEQVIERKDYSCEVACITCQKPTDLYFRILPDACQPLTSLQAVVTPNSDQQTVKLTISANNTDMATAFKIGYRRQGDANYTYVNPNPISLPFIVDNLENAIYEVEVTKITEDDTCPPQTAVSNATELNPFDYLVVRYLWTEFDGRDLDTFTGFINTGTIYDNDWVGYGQGDPKVPAGAADAMAYLYWASDNTQTGVEAVLMNLKQFIVDNTGTPEEVQVRMNAVWYSQKISGNVSVQLTTYLGGTMSKVGFDFVNTGGVQIDQVTLQTNVDIQSTSANISNSTNVAIVKYNKTTKAATIQLI